MPKPRIKRRKQILVERKVQLRFARFVILFVIGTAFLTSTVVFLTTFSLLGEKVANVYPQGRLVEIFRTVYIAFIINLLIATPVIFYISLLFSHRIVGPLPKIYDFLRGIGKGEFARRITLRQKDELHELADVMNEMAEMLEKRTSKSN